MPMTKLLFTALLAAAAPLALAAPLTFTNTTHGVVTSNTLNFHPDIPVGVAFEMTTVAQFDSDDVVLAQEDWQDREWVEASHILITLKAGGKSFEFDNGGYGGRLSTDVTEVLGVPRLYLSLAFYAFDPTFYFDVFTRVDLDQAGDMPPLLLTPGASVSYAAPFSSSASFYERLTGERSGDLELAVTSTQVSVSAVPEPATYGMLFAGLGVLGVLGAPARRARAARARE